MVVHGWWLSLAGTNSEVALRQLVVAVINCMIVYVADLVVYHDLMWYTVPIGRKINKRQDYMDKLAGKASVGRSIADIYDRRYICRQGRI